MRLLPGHELQFVESPGGNAGAAIATPSRGAGEVSVIRQRQAAGGSNPEHSHDREEVMVVLAGEVTVQASGSRAVLRAGDSALIPAGTLHRLANHGTDEAEWLVIAPAGVAFLHADGQAADPSWAQ